MEKILLNQNLNLKEQNHFLSMEVRKALKREEKYKEETRTLSYHLKKVTENNNSVEMEYESIKGEVQKQLEYLIEGLQVGTLN